MSGDSDRARSLPARRDQGNDLKARIATQLVVTEVIWFRQVPQGWEISVHVQPGARRSEVAGLHGAALKVRLQAPALEGKANAALTRLLADRLDLPARAVSIVSGMHARDKRVLIESAQFDPRRLLE